MERNEIILKTEEIFKTIFDDENLKLTDEMTAADVKGWDSLTHIQLIVSVEKKFEIKFSLKEIMNLKNVGDLIDTIKEKIK